MTLAGAKPGAGRVESLEEIARRVVSCTRCQRLRSYCLRVAEEKKAAHRVETYWGRPVPGFGDPRARLLVVGLAPAAHGANRTGRVFTGDGSGDFLMRAMHGAGFANIPTSRSPGDGLELYDAYIAATVRCAPPDNKPARDEIGACREYLEAEFRALAGVRVIVALGRVAFEQSRLLIASSGARFAEPPLFAHLAVAFAHTGLALLASYHPSRQNTNTGKLTAAMLAEVFLEARRILDTP
ncbi:MAG: uracil-DNA glycosylase [Acidobacteria bacterium]|nr:MAG: uracil-DNA glycosylase [Acidobacteriota bacterium]RPJ84502.1 MAG: uracil-DNA glycosylase [Acidobacteriota bacterium]